MKVNNVADKGTGLKSSDEDIIMGISENNHLTLLNSLTNLYANPVMAALREYSANASDAHKVSGQTKPFEIDFPYYLNGATHLRIRDYGSGMTKEQIVKIYSQYGASTKGSSNLTVGGFGLGSKSGLAVSDHLYVNTIADGTLIKAQILKNEDNTSVIRILSEEPSSAPSGTEILLPLTRAQLTELENQADEELMGYEPTTVILNKKPLALHLSNPEQFIPVQSGNETIAYIARRPEGLGNAYPLGKIETADLTMFKTQHLNVVMGSVFYRNLPPSGSVPNKEIYTRLFMSLMRRLQNSPRVILNIPVGSVDLPPHRDSIIDTKKSWDSLISLMENLLRALDSSVSKYLNEQPVEIAAGIVASMPGLFTSSCSWVHRGKKYSNIFDGSGGNPLIYEAQVGSGYVGRSKNLGEHTWADAHTKKQTSYRWASNNSLSGKDAITAARRIVVHLKLTKDKFDDIETVMRLTPNRSPKAYRLIRQYLLPVLAYQFPRGEFMLLISLETDEIPVHLKPAIEHSYTESEIRKTHKLLFPPAPKLAVTQHHGRVGRDSGISYGLISSDEKVVYFAGKGQYKPSSFIRKSGSRITHNHKMKSIASGNFGSNYRSYDLPWLRKGLFKLVTFDTSLVALSETNPVEDFQKEFPTAVPLGELVMDYYDKLDDVRKLAVQHAYSILALWASTNSDRLFRYIAEEKSEIKNPAVRAMIEEPVILAIANYIYSFSDQYVEGLDEWKKKFVNEVSGKTLAGVRLLPLHMLIEPKYSEDNAITAAERRSSIPTKFKLQDKDYEFKVSDLLGYIDVLTADL